MVYQEKVFTIVTLCENPSSHEASFFGGPCTKKNLQEHTKAIEYWPEEVGTSMDIWAAELKLAYISKEDLSPGLCKREFALIDKVLLVPLKKKKKTIDWNKETSHTISYA